MEAKWILPMLSLSICMLASDENGLSDATHESLNPKVAFAWFIVICLEILDTFL